MFFNSHNDYNQQLYLTLAHAHGVLVLVRQLGINQLSVQYILYLDEAGDPGIKKISKPGLISASEWFTIGAYLIRADREEELRDNLKEIRRKLNIKQRPDLHYKTLSPTRRKVACGLVAELPGRMFCVITNKANMEGYVNWKAHKAVGKQAYFYNFIVRVVLERVTDWVYRDSLKRYTKPAKLKIVLSQRGGVKYDHFKDYVQTLCAQSKYGSLILDQQRLAWQVIDTNQIFDIPHSDLAGLQVADLIASAFYQAVNTSNPKFTNEPALALAPRIARSGKSGIDIEHYGVTLFPTLGQLQKMNLQELTFNPCQIELFKKYGFQRKFKEAAGPGSRSTASR